MVETEVRGDAPSLRESPAPDVPWRCFHCNEVFTDHADAADHFGTDWFCEDEGPACIQILTEGEKAIVNSRREAGRLMREAEAEAEKVSDDFSALRWEVHGLVKRYGKGRDGPELRHILEDLEGRALAAEAALNAAPRWLSGFLRWRAEWLWKRTKARTGRLRRQAEVLASESSRKDGSSPQKDADHAL